MRKTNIPYRILLDMDILIDSAFGFGENPQQLTLKECLLDEIDYNPEDIINALEDVFNIPSYEDEEKKYCSITRKEWEDILDVDNTSANIKYYDIHQYNDNSVELFISVKLDIDKFEDMCNKHNIEISVEKEL